MYNLLQFYDYLILATHFVEFVNAAASLVT